MPLGFFFIPQFYSKLQRTLNSMGADCLKTCWSSLESSFARRFCTMSTHKDTLSFKEHLHTWLVEVA